MLMLRFDGPLANFTPPYAKSEGSTYPVPTPTALAPIIGAYHWRPGMDYRVKRYAVLREPETFTMTVNHVNEKVSEAHLTGQKLFVTSEMRAQRQIAYIVKPSYLVECVIVIDGEETPDNNYAKHAEMLKRRIGAGRAHFPPYFGRKHCPISMAAIATEDDIARVPDINMDIGRLPLCRQVLPDGRVEFAAFHARLEHGWIHVPAYTPAFIYKRKERKEAA